MMPDAFGEVRRCSASWLAMNISILRTVFDKIHGLSLLEGLRGSGTTRARMLPIPTDISTLLTEGKRRFADDAPLFPGRRPGTALSTRMAERIVCRCAKRAALPRHVTSMVLRHTYAVHALEAGVNIREIQTNLGHANVVTTMLYQQCLLPEEATSPLDTMPASSDISHIIAPPPPTNLTRAKHEPRKNPAPAPLKVAA